jgi:hypothetical protein
MEDNPESDFADTNFAEDLVICLGDVLGDLGE